MSTTIKGINVEIGYSTTGLAAALKDVNNASREISKELRQVENLLKFNPKDTELLAQKQQLLGDQIANTSEKLKRLKDVQEQVNEQFKKGDITEAQHRAFQRELVKTESQLKSYKEQLKAVNRENDTFKQQMDKLGKSLDEAGKKLASVGGDLSKKLTLPLAGLGAVAVKIGIDFEAAMSQVQASSGASTAEMGRLEKAARDAGASTSKSATDAANALSYMALAGWDTKTSMDALMPVLRLSEAGNIDLARASSLVTDSMATLGLTAQELPGYLDTVAQTARNSNTSIDQMTEAYIKAGGTLRGLKVPLEESSVALGMLANAGIKGTEAGTSFNAVLLNLTAPVGRAKQALEELGYSAFDSQGNFKGLDKVLFELKDRLAGMDDEQRNMYLSMIGGKEHVRSLNALLNGLDDSYTDLKGAVNDADGALEDMAKTMMDNTKGSLIELRSALQELGLKVFDIMAPSIKKVTDAVKDFVKWIDNLNPAVQRTIVIIGTIVAAIGPALILFGKLTSGVGALMTTLGTLSAFIKTTLIPAIAGISLTTVATVGAVVGLAVVAYEVYRAWDEVKAALSATWDLIKASAVQLGINVSMAMEQMKHATLNAVKEMLERLSVLEKLPWGIGEKFAGLKDGVSDSVDGSNKKLEELKQAAEENALRIKEATEKTKVAFSDLGQKVAENVKRTITSLTGAIEEQNTISEAALKKRAELQEEFDKSWLTNLNENAETRLNALAALEQKALANAEELEASKTEITKFFAKKRQEILDAAADRENKKREEKTAEAEAFEQKWNAKLAQLTATRLEQLDAEMAAELAKAKELQADKTAIIEYYAVKRQQILDEEAEKEAEREKKRRDSLEKFEEDWAKKLFEHTASKLEILEKEKQEALAKAEALGADKTTIIEYYALKQQEILDEQAKAEEEQNKKQHEKLTSFEEQWQTQLFKATASKLEILEKEKEQALAIAEELGANKLDIISYYELQEQKIFDEQAKAEEERQKKQLEELASFEERWQDQLFKASATNIEILEKEKEQALAIAEKLGSDKTAIIEYYALKQQEILDEQAKAEEERNKKRFDSIAEFEELWAKKVFAQSATRLEILEREKQEALAKAEALGAGTLEIVEYYANEEKKILDDQAKEKEKKHQEEIETEKRRQQSIADQKLAWEKRLAEQTASDLEKLKMRRQEELDRAEKLGIDKTAIIEYYANEEKKILTALQAEKDKQAEAEKDRLEKELKTREQFEASWNDKLFEATADRIDILEKEREEAVKEAEQLGADTVAIMKYYDAEIIKIREQRAKESAKIAEAEAEKEKKILEEREKLRKEYEQSWEDKLFGLTATREEQLEREKQEALARAEKLGADVNKILEYYARRQIELAEETAKEQMSIWDKMAKLSDPIDILTNSFINAGAKLANFIENLKVGDWKKIILSVLVETESFAKLMELLNTMLAPLMVLFDSILQPIINRMLDMWNFIADALDSISIFGWKPFAGIKDKRIGLVGGSENENDKGSGGSQVSEITGPTRDLFVDLLTPLANLSQIVAPLQDIRSILDSRLPYMRSDYGFAVAGGAGGAGGGGDVIIENLNVTAPTTGINDISRATIDEIEKALAGRIAFNHRGRGSR